MTEETTIVKQAVEAVFTKGVRTTDLLQADGQPLVTTQRWDMLSSRHWIRTGHNPDGEGIVRVVNNFTGS